MIEQKNALLESATVRQYLDAVKGTAPPELVPDTVDDFS
jgi:hypothetical protein